MLLFFIESLLQAQNRLFLSILRAVAMVVFCDDDLVVINMSRTTIPFCGCFYTYQSIDRSIDRLVDLSYLYNAHEVLTTILFIVNHQDDWVCI